MYGNKTGRNPFKHDPFQKGPAPKPQFQRRPQQQRKPVLNRDEYMKAKQLESQSGITFSQAVQVVKGKISLNDLLKRLLAAERLKRAPGAKDLTPDLLGQVACGRMSVDQARAIEKTLKHPGYKGKRSILQDAFESKAAIAMVLFGRLLKVGRVERNEKYKILIACDGMEPDLMDKVLIKYAGYAELADWIHTAFAVEPEMAGKTVEPIKKRVERPKWNADVLFDAFDKGVPLRVATLEGDLLSGRIEWFGKWEVGLRLESGQAVTVFRHAIREAGI